MKRKNLLYRVASLILIVVLLTTQSSIAQAAQGVKSNKEQTSDRGKKDRPVGEKVKTKKPATIPYGILKNEDILAKWSNKKEIIANRTNNSKTYLNEDGSKTTLIFSEPIHMKAGKNASEKAKYGKNNLKESDYLEINNDLISTEIKGKGTYKNTFGLYDVYFPNDKTGIQVEQDGVALNLIPEGLNWADMEIEGNQAYVPAQTDGITYVYTVNSTSLKEDIVMNYLTDQQEFSYELNVGNQYDVTVIDGVLYVQDRDSKDVYYSFSAPFMTDREGNINSNITIELSGNNGKYIVTIHPDQDWLKDPLRAYPVVIDPILQVRGGSVFFDTYVQEKQPNITQFTRPCLYIGYDDGDVSGNDPAEGKTRSYIKFSLPEDLTADSTVLSATLNMHAYTNWSRSARTIDIKKPLRNVAIPPASASSSSTCVSWSSQPDLGATIASEVITGRGDYSWNIKSAVTEWVNGEPNYGLALKMNNEYDQAEVFYSAQGSIKPYVEISYREAPELTPTPEPTPELPEPDPASDPLKLILERTDKYNEGTASVESKIKWTAETDTNDAEDQLSEGTDKFNKATIKYTLMPDGISYTIVEENFMELPWETEKFDLEKDKAYWIEAEIKIEQWVAAEQEADGGSTGGTQSEDAGEYEEIYNKTLKTKKFVVAEAQPGDTLKRLAKYYTNYGSKSTDIYDLNKLEEERLFVGQKLFIMTEIEDPYNYDQPEAITSTIMKQDAVAGSVSNPTETVGQFINPATGAFNYYQTDFNYQVYNSSIDFTRSYTSTLKNRKSPLGDGWDYNYNKYLVFYKDGKIGYNVGDGSRVYFTKSGSAYTTTAPTYDELIQSGDGYEIQTSEKDVYTFNSIGLLTKVADKSNNITDITYNSNDWQTQITDALDRIIALQYYGSGTGHVGNIKEVKLPDSSIISFIYEQDNNHLASYSDRESNKTSYSYNAEDQLEQIVEPESNTILTNSYTAEGKVTEQLDGEDNTTSLSYSGSTTTVYDGRNLPYSYQFDSQKRVIKKTYPDTKYEAYQYNTKWDVLTYTDRMGRQHKYTYNTLGYITSYTRPEDQKVYSYEYQDEYLLSQTIDFAGNKNVNTYDNNDNLDKVIQYNVQDGIQKQIITDYNYQANGLLDRIVDPDGIITQIDNSGYPRGVTTTTGGITSIERYDLLGRLISSTDGNDNTTSTTYDKNGNIIAILQPSDDEMNRVISYTYDMNGNQESVTGSREIPDGDGYATTLYTYDGNNRLIQTTDPYGGVVTNIYDGNGKVTAVIDEEQNKTTYEYDNRNQLKSIYQPGQTLPAFTYEYDALGNNTKITEADGDYTEYEYNYKIGQVSKEINPENNIISYTYDDMGNLLSQKEPDSKTTYVYDDLYRTVEIQQTGTATQWMTYTDGGEIAQIKDEKGFTNNYHYDSVSGLLLDVTEETTEYFSQLDNQPSTQIGLISSFALNPYPEAYPMELTLFSLNEPDAFDTITRTYTTEYTYDANGNMKTVKDKEGNITTYEYNELNEVSVVIDPMNKITRYYFDEDGNVSKTIDGEGNVTETQYDALNRTYKVLVPEENTTETYLYNSRGLLQTYVDPMGNITAYNYDNNGRVYTVTNANLQTLKYNYNSDDTLSKIIYPNGETEEYTYDGLNRADGYKDRSGVTYAIDYTPSGQADYISDSVGNHVDYTYDYLGRLIQEKDTAGRVTTYNYDSYGRMISETGTDGNTTTYKYDSYDRITRITDPENKVTNVIYNTQDNVTRIIAPGSRIYTYDYDPSGNLTKVTDPLGNATQYYYNNNNEVSEIINAKGFSKKYEYNALNQVEKATDERNYTTSYNYYPGGLLRSVTDPLNNTTSYTYDPMNQVSTITNALYETTAYNYDFFGNTTSVSDSRGVTTSYTYNARDQIELTYDTQNNLTRNEYYANGDLMKTTDQEGRVTQYNYDELHRITQTVDPNGLTTYYIYNAVTGDLDREYDNAGQETTYIYDKMHRVLTETDIQGLVTSYTYDEFGNLATETTPEGNTTTYSYDELDRVTSIIDPENKVTEYVYDPAGNVDYEIRPTNQKYDYTYDATNNLQSILDPLGQITTYTYDANNNMSTLSDPAGNLYSYSYDALNRLKTINDLSGSGSTYKYDESGNLNSFIDGNGNTTKYQYNNLNKLESVEDGEGNVTRYTYFKDGNLQSMTDANGNTSTYTYDAKGNLNSFINPLGETVKYNYNLLGQVEEEIKADGNIIDYVYDDYNRLESIIYPDQTSVKYTYDEYNRKVSMEDSNGLTEYAYDGMGRLTWVSDPNGEEISYEYDDKGRKTSVIYPDGKYVDYQYDDFDRIIGVNDREGRITRFTYDDAGRKKTTALPNGITTTYEYDQAGRITGITSVKEDGTNVLKFGYTYDGAGNRISEEIWQEDKHYLREYTYYKNNTVKSMTESGDNNVSYAYTYDSAGNITEKRVTKEGTTKVTKFSYDIANRMISETDEAGDTTTYRYDANGNRTERVLDPDSAKAEDAASTGTVDGTGIEAISESVDSNGLDNISENDSASSTVTNSDTTDTSGKSNGKSGKSGNASKSGTQASDTEVYVEKQDKETVDYYYYDYEDRLVEIVIHNGKVFTYGYDGEGNRLWRTYSQYPLVKPPVDEGELVDDPATFPGYNKDNSDKSNNGNGKGKKNNSSESTGDITLSSITNTNENSNTENTNIANTAESEIEIFSLAAISENDDLISAVDSYLMSFSVDKTDKDNNGNNGNGNNGNGNGQANTNGNDGSHSNGNDGNNGNGNTNGNGNGNSNNNGNGNGNSNSNGNGNANGNGNNDNKEKGNNGNGNSKADEWKSNGAKTDHEKANGKTKDHTNNGNDKNKDENGNGKANGKNKVKENQGKHLGWYKNGKYSGYPDAIDFTNPEIFEVTNYINDPNQEYTQVLMTADVDRNYRGVYTYADGERLCVEDLVEVEGKPNNPLYYLSDALGTTTAITNMNAEIIDNNRFAPYGEAISPVAKNSRLTNSPWGYTGESHDIEAGLVYLRARYYEPETGRFIQQDSYPYFGVVENPLSRNLYAYCNDNPIMYTDPKGHSPVTVGHIYVIDGVYKGKESIYVGSTAQELRKRMGNHKWKTLVKAADTKVYTYEVKADLNVSASGKGTYFSARNEALRAAEQTVYDKVKKYYRGKKGILNDINAATPKNRKTWTKLHNVEVGQPKLTLKGGIKVSAFVGFTLLDIFMMYREEKLSQYVFAPYLLEDEGGVFTLQEEKKNWFAHHYYWKNYVDGPKAGKKIEITKKEFMYWKKEAELLWGTVDIFGNFVPGLLQPTLPTIEICNDPNMI